MTAKESLYWTQNIFKVWKSADEDGRSGVQKVLGYFMERVGADIAAKKQGNWGGDATVEEVQAVIVCIEPSGGAKRYYILGAEVQPARTREQIREDALKKLTPEERDALGIKS